MNIKRLDARECRNAVEILDEYGRVRFFQPVETSEWQPVFTVCMDWLSGVVKAADPADNSRWMRSARLSAFSSIFRDNLELACRRASDKAQTETTSQ